MSPRRYASGKLPADTAPITKGDVKPGAGIQDLGTRLDNMAVTRTTPATRVKAAAYLVDQGETRDVAEHLGLEEFYDRVSAIRAAETSQPTA